MSSQQLGPVVLGTVEVPKSASPSSFVYTEVRLGALAASLAANPKRESADSTLVATHQLVACDKGKQWYKTLELLEKYAAVIPEA